MIRRLAALAAALLLSGQALAATPAEFVLAGARDAGFTGCDTALLAEMKDDLPRIGYVTVTRYPGTGDLLAVRYTYGRGRDVVTNNLVWMKTGGRCFVDVAVSAVFEGMSAQRYMAENPAWKETARTGETIWLDNGRGARAIVSPVGEGVAIRFHMEHVHPQDGK